MSARNEDFLFAQEAQALGYVSEEQVEEGFLLQKRMAEDLKIDERLAVILVKRGWMAEEQAKRVLGIVEPEGTRSQIEGYRLVQMIGRGAMGTVYKAIHKGLHRVVAIKILRRDLATDKTQVERLKREATLLADLDHPNIVRAFDAGESNGFPYLVMEYVEGETLRDRIARKGGMSNEEALRITRALADALEKARRMGVVHRDVKPGNVLMSTSGTPKIMDLGLAKGPLDLGLTQHGATVGTPQFISPEQAQDPRKADTRSDIYSLGASLYAMVTTRPPFEGSTLAEIITKVLYEQPVPPRMRNPNVSPEVGHLIERMMLKDPTLRYQTPADVVADIDMIRGGQSIVPAGFTGNWEAYLLRQRSRKLIRLTAVGVAAALVLGVVGFTWWQRVQREKAQEVVNRTAAMIVHMDDPRRGDTADEIRERLETAQRLNGRIERCEREDGAHCPERGSIRRRIELYEANLEKIQAFEQVKKLEIDKLLGVGNFRGALLRAEEFIPKAQGFLAALHMAEEAAKAVREASDEQWKRSRDAIEKKTVRDLGEFAAKWGALEAETKGDYAKTPFFQRERVRAKDLGLAAARILSEVTQVDKAFAEDVVAARIADLELMQLRDQLRAFREEALGAVISSHHEPFRKHTAVPIQRLTGSAGFVRLALKRIDDRFRAQVDAYWQSLRKLAPTLAVDEALERLSAFEAAADRGSVFPELSRQARVLALSIDRERVEAMRASQVAYRRVRDEVLAALRAGDPDKLRAVIEEARGRPLSHKRQKDVEQLVTGAEALDALYEAALVFLERAAREGSRVKVVLRGSDGEVVTWRGFEVDREQVAVRVKVPRRTSPTGYRLVPLKSVILEYLLTWAMRSGTALSAFHAALVKLGEIAPPHDDPADLRPLIQKYGLTLDALEELEGERKTWAGIVRSLLEQLTTTQHEREESVGAAIEAINQNWVKENYWLTLKLIEVLSAKDNRLRYTDGFDKSRAQLEEKARVCRDVLVQEELLRLLPGADVKEGALGSPLEGWRRFLFDFNDEFQLENFVSGLGRLVPQKDAAITPVGLTPYRLMLLHGRRGLVRDRPLAIHNMMDPHHRIVVELDLEPQGRGSFLVAFDIDGVQIAVCSADPNYWKWRFRPPAPLLDGEDVLPEFDFYGRGRGVAFHSGPDFGPAFPLGNWDWADFGEGRHFEQWKDSEFLQGKRRSRLFAFEPGRRYRVKLVRTRGELQLWVDGEMVSKKHDASWTHRGKHSDIDKLTRGGSGRIQILTWTPMAIDNLSIEGKVMDSWRRHQELRLNKKKKGK